VNQKCVIYLDWFAQILITLLLSGPGKTKNRMNLASLSCRSSFQLYYVHVLVHCKMSRISLVKRVESYCMSRMDENKLIDLHSCKETSLTTCTYAMHTEHYTKKYFNYGQKIRYISILNLLLKLMGIERGWAKTGINRTDLWNWSDPLSIYSFDKLQGHHLERSIKPIFSSLWNVEQLRQKS